MEGTVALLCGRVRSALPLFCSMGSFSTSLHQDAESEPGPARAVESEGGPWPSLALPHHFSCLFLAPVVAVWSKGKPNLMPFIWVCLGSNNEVKFDSWPMCGFQTSLPALCHFLRASYFLKTTHLATCSLYP